MIDIKIQLVSLGFSYLYGIFFYLIYVLSYQFLYKKKYQIISNLVFSIFIALLYFVCLLKINNGIIHPYMILMTILGFITIKKIITS